MADIDANLAGASSPRRDRGEPEIQLLEQLVSRLGNVQVADNRPTFKPPKYDGSTDIELFIIQFSDVARANRWSDEQSLLHLRTCLEGPAMDCGRERHTEEVFQSLQTRFGVTPKQARDQLKVIRKKPKQSYHELGSEISRLVGVAYSQETISFRTQTSLETFSHAVQLKPLRQHLLARPHRSIAEAVTIANEFMTIEGPAPTLASLEAQPERITPDKPPTSELSVLIKLLVDQQTLLAEWLKSVRNTPAPPPDRRRGPCFICSGEHWKRECPQARRPEHQQTRRAGNSQAGTPYPTEPYTTQEGSTQAGNAQGLGQC